MIGEIARHGEFAAVQRRIANSIRPVLGLNLEGNEIATRTGDNDFRGFDLQHRLSHFLNDRTGSLHVFRGRANREFERPGAITDARVRAWLQKVRHSFF